LASHALEVSCFEDGLRAHVRLAPLDLLGLGGSYCVW